MVNRNMLKQIAKTLKQSINTAPYILIYGYDCRWHIYNFKECNKSIYSHSNPNNAEDECERLNNEWIAWQIIECINEHNT